jgi:hypothetical protein
VVDERVRRHRQTGTGSTNNNNNTDCCVGGIMVVEFVGLAPSFILAHYYHHVESRHTCPTPVLLHHPSNLLLSTLPSHISNAISRVVREYVRARLTYQPTNRTSLLLLLLLLHHTTTRLLHPSCNSYDLSPRSLSSISNPASTSTHHVIHLAV